MKKCNKCWVLKDLSMYSKQSSKKDWLSGICKDCVKIRSKEYYSKNKEMLIKKSTDYFLNNKERLYKYKIEWYHSNPEKIKEQYNRKKQRPWHKICTKLNKQKRRTILNNCFDDWSITKQALDNMLVNQNYKCVYCWCDISLLTNTHLDHIFPISKWGSNTINNVQWTCSTCNLRKWAKTEEEFLKILLGSSAAPKQ